MKNIIIQIRSAASLLLVSTILLGVIYPLVITAIAQVVFHEKANGSLITINEKIIGSRLIGQEFTQDKYFWGRLSANKHNPSASAGANLSMANPKLLESVNARVEALKKADPINKAKIPVDLVTASASGLDPHITLLAAEYQIDRIAKARQMNPDEVQQLIIDHVYEESYLFGEPYVNVLELNLALDNLTKSTTIPQL